MVDCPIGKCSTALICENCSQLSAQSARYALDNVSAIRIYLPFVYFTTMSYSNRRSSIPWIRLGALNRFFFDNRLQGFMICVGNRFPTKGLLVETFKRLFARIQLQ